MPKLVTFLDLILYENSSNQLLCQIVCGGIIQESRGVIKSPKYPSNYPASTTCEWDVRVRAGRTISVRFDNMQIASDPPACSQDYVIVSLC